MRKAMEAEHLIYLLAAIVLGILLFMVIKRSFGIAP